MAPGGVYNLELGALPRNFTRIETRSARVEIICRDGLVLTAGVDTVLHAATLARESPGMLFRLTRGIIGLFRPPDADGNLGVKTDLAIAAARSTEWMVTHESGRTAVFVRDGGVVVDSLAPEQRSVLLRAGDGVDATTEGLDPVVQWGAKRIAESAAALGHGWH